MEFKAFKTSHASEALVSHSGNIASTRRSQGIPEGAGQGVKKPIEMTDSSKLITYKSALRRLAMTGGIETSKS